MKKKIKILHDCRGMSEDEIIQSIFQDRGINDIPSFLYPSSDSLIPYDKMKNINKGYKIIQEGVDSGATFAVKFDVDTDGCTAGSIAYKELQRKGAKVKAIINQGKAHGITESDYAELKGIDILWIVDSIETLAYPYKELFKAGIKKIVITDHHIVTPSVRSYLESNPNVALISSAVGYSNPELSGSGVTWKLCQYIDWMELDDYSDDLADLAACGIISDITSVGIDSMENRYICSLGFENPSNLAIEKINGSYPFNAQAVSFGIAPLVNAANRTDHNDAAMELFVEDDLKNVKEIIKTLKGCKETQNEEVARLAPQLDSVGDSQLDKKVMFFFVNTENDIKGLLGNKLLEKYKRPIIIVSPRIKEIDEETGEATKIEYFGSCRACGVENFKKIVDGCGFVGTGGHENSFGIWFDVDVFEDFQNYLERELENVEFVTEITADIQITPDQITDCLIDKMKEINKITGKNFPAIKVFVSDIEGFEVGTMSKGKHLKLMTDSNLIYIKWNYSPDNFHDKRIHAIGTLDSGFFGRTYYRQFIMNDWLVDSDLEM